MILVKLTPEDVYKEIKKNIIFDFETILDYGDNGIEKEIQTEWGLIKISFVVMFTNDGEYNELEVSYVLYPEVYNNEGAKIEIDLSYDSLMDSLKHLNIKY